MPLPRSLRIGARFAAPIVVILALLALPGLAAAEPDAPDGRVSKRVWLTVLYGGPAAPVSNNRYETIPVLSPSTNPPAASHPDLNLALRGYSTTNAALALVSYNGGTDPDAPQMPGIFADRRTPKFTSAYRVNDWSWGCNCRGGPLTSWPVTLLGMSAKAGELLAAPSRGAEIYPGGYKALVLYADETRITLKYTREDGVVSGYTVHLENLTIDPNLLSLYRQANAAGRGNLPALRDGQPLGVASGAQVLVAIRDCGTFLDPRSRKDWWQGR